MERECRHGVNCKFLKKDKCKNFHPKSDYEKLNQLTQNQSNSDSEDLLKVEKLDYQTNQSKNSIKKEQKRLQKQQQQLQNKLNNQQQQEQQDENMENNNNYKNQQPQKNIQKYKQKNQTLKDYYSKMLNQNQQITDKAHWIESQEAGYAFQQFEQTEEEKQEQIKLQQELYNEFNKQIAKQQNLQVQVKIGIDFGNVIVGADPQAPQDTVEDTMFGENFLQTPMIPDAFKAIKILVDKFGADNIYIVSKCGEKMQNKTIQWIYHHKLQENTGLLVEKNIFFCKERSQKAGICYENKINYFIDDKQDVLQNMNNTITKFLFPTPKTKRQAGKTKQFYHVEGWQHLIDIFNFIQVIQ